MGDHKRERQRFYGLARAIKTYLGETCRNDAAGEVARYLTRMYLHDRKSCIVSQRLQNTLRFRNQADIQLARKWLQTRSLTTACYWISSFYSVLVPAERRLELALYFTPPQLGAHVVRRVSQLSPSFASARILDPACGGAAFLVPAVALLRRELRQMGFNAAEALRHVETRVTGWERDPVLAYLSRIFLCHVMETETARAGRTLNPRIEVVNTLRRAEGTGQKGFDIVLCNPPYRKIGAQELPAFRKRHAHLICGQPNLYALFSATALTLARPGGIVALLTPTSFVSGDTFALFRKHLLSHSTVTALEMIHERKGVFHEVEQDAALTICERRLSSPVEQRPTISSWTLRGPTERLGKLRLPLGGEPWRIPRTKEHLDLLKRVERSPWRLEAYGYRAVVGSFVWNRDPRRCLRAYPKGKRREKTYPVIWASHIHARRRFQFRPRSDKEAKRKYVVLKGERDLVSVRRSASVLLQRTSSRAQTRRLVATVLPQDFVEQYNGFVAENHVVVLEPNCARPLVSLGQLCRVLRSQILQDAYSMASGTSAVTVTGLSNLPLPDPAAISTPMRSHRAIERAIRRGYAPSNRAALRERATHASIAAPRAAR